MSHNEKREASPRTQFKNWAGDQDPELLYNLLHWGEVLGDDVIRDTTVEITRPTQGGYYDCYLSVRHPSITAGYHAVVSAMTEVQAGFTTLLGRKFTNREGGGSTATSDKSWKHLLITTVEEKTIPKFISQNEGPVYTDYIRYVRQLEKLLLKVRGVMADDYANPDGLIQHANYPTRLANAQTSVRMAHGLPKTAKLPWNDKRVLSEMKNVFDQNFNCPVTWETDKDGVVTDTPNAIFYQWPSVMFPRQRNKTEPLVPNPPLSADIDQEEGAKILTGAPYKATIVRMPVTGEDGVPIVMESMSKVSELPRQSWVEVAFEIHPFSTVGKKFGVHLVVSREAGGVQRTFKGQPAKPVVVSRKRKWAAEHAAAVAREEEERRTALASKRRTEQLLLTDVDSDVEPDADMGGDDAEVGRGNDDPDRPQLGYGSDRNGSDHPFDDGGTQGNGYGFPQRHRYGISA